MNKIVIVGGYGVKNFGDDALMVAAHKILESCFKTADIVIFCNNAGYIARLLPEARVVSCPSSRTDADLIVFGGGTQFYSFPLTSVKRGLLSRILRLISSPGRLHRYWCEKKKEKLIFKPSSKRMAIGLGVGPFMKGDDRSKYTKRLLSRMGLVSVRDKASLQFCEEWNIENTSLGSDLCYFEGLWDIDEVPYKVEPINIKKVGIVIRDWNHSNEGSAFSGPLLKSVKLLRGGGYDVTFISFSQLSDKLWLEKLKTSNEEVLKWDPEKMVIQEFLGKLVGFDCIVTARYHGAIFSSILGIPVVCVGIEPKLHEVSDLIGKGARLWRFPFNERDIPVFIKSFTKADVCAYTGFVKEQRQRINKMKKEIKDIYLD